MRNPIFGLALLLGSVTPSFAGDLAIFEHNGSEIALWIGPPPDGKTVATYVTPRRGLEAAGVKEGTLLFEGNMDEEGRIVGTAYAFKRGCPPAPYRVAGGEEDGRIVLRGAGPVRAPNGCDVTAYAETSPHATLVFKYARPHD